MKIKRPNVSGGTLKKLEAIATDEGKPTAAVISEFVDWGFPIIQYLESQQIDRAMALGLLKKIVPAFNSLSHDSTPLTASPTVPSSRFETPNPAPVAAPIAAPIAAASRGGRLENLDASMFDY